ncbi:UDP-glucosyltransferase 2-like [Arctopsyche grandis]|uniref:UDP-glucosyltransferase 2-like n=1 Tax=Arctopsyche grandis TaxID=121162 RepID=UPI00406D73EB
MSAVTVILVLCAILLLSTHQVHSFNILWLAGITSPSHQIWGGVLQRALAERGHNITALSVDVYDVKVPNLTYIHLENVYNYFSVNASNLTRMMNADPFKAISTLASYRSNGCSPALRSNGFNTLMAYPKDFNFDLVVHDFVGAQCLLGFVSRFSDPPLISLSATTCPVAISSASGNPQYPEYVPANHLNVGFSMSYLNRVYNSLLYTFDNIVRFLFMIPEQDKIAKEFFRNENLDIAAISKSSVLTLVNLPPYDVMQPFFQTVIPVGGMQIQKPKPLNDKLNTFISKYKDGIVYFAFGTNIRAEDFSQNKVKNFLEAFKQFPTHGFLWKYKPEVMKHTLPENVLLEGWLPQNDILAHNDIKVFIGHGGALSCQEATWYGIPQLLIPFIIDQKHNAARAVERGMALKLDHNELTTEVIANALRKLIYDVSFRKKSKIFSSVFRDQPQSPLDRAIYWIEYVLKHGQEVKLLRSPGQDMTKFYQILPDLIIALVVVSVGSILVGIFGSIHTKRQS